MITNEKGGKELKKSWKKITAKLLCLTLVLCHGVNVTYAEEAKKEATETVKEEAETVEEELETVEEVTDKEGNIKSTVEINSEENVEVIAKGSCSENVKWVLDVNGCLTISGKGAMPRYATDRLIPWAAYKNKIISVNIEEGITEISQYAFGECNNLKELNIPKSMKYMESGDVIYGCSSLGVINVAEGNETYCSIDGALFAKEGKHLVYCSGDNREDYIIPDQVNYICGNAFSGCKSLKSVKIPDGVTNIDRRAFSGCTGLVEVTIPNSTINLGDGAFIGCTSLQNIKLPEGAREVPADFFANCESLRELIIPSSVSDIGMYAFSGCVSLEKITIPYATYIGSGAFEGCCNLVNITLPLGIKYITDYLFESCEKLESICIPGMVEEIEESAFEGCSNLKHLCIPTSVTKIKSKIIDGCDFITIYYAGSEEEWNNIDIDSDNDTLNTLESKGGIIFNSTGDKTEGGDTKENINENVSYFSKWDAAKQIAYFGDSDLTGSQVTEETDVSFLDNVEELIGKYVLVKTKSREDDFIAPDTLLSIKKIDNKSGTVTAATESSITIDGKTYFATLAQPESYVGKFVLYHILENNFVSVQLLEKGYGILTSWNAETGRLKIGDEYKIGEGAEQAAFNFLGKTKYTSVMVQFLHDEYKNVYQITDKLDKNSDFTGPTYYDTYIPPAKDEVILTDEFTEWETAYEQYINSIHNALQKFAQTDSEKREAVISAEAKRMQKADENSDSKYLTGELGNYKAYCYKALAEYLYDHTCEKINLSSVDLTSSSAPTALIKAVARGMDGDEKTYEYGNIKITLNILIVNSAKTGHLLVKNNGKNVVTAVVCSNREEIEKSVSEYVNELKALATNSVYNVSSAVYQDILGQSISKLTEQYVSQAISKIEKKFQVVLSEKFGSAGVGNLVKTLNECYSYYSYIKKNLDTEKLDDIEKVLKSIENLEFKDATIKDPAVKKSVKALQKAKNSFLKSYEKHLEGTLSENNKGYFKIHIKCPVDVEVYNSSGELIGCASETELWYNDSIIITDIGEAKTITSLTDDLITFKVNSREDGTMDCTIEEFNENHEPIGRLNYYDITLKQEQEYDITLMNDLLQNRDKLTFNVNGEAIAADEYISAEDNAKVVISCGVETEGEEEGGQIRGVGTYIRGNAVVLYADPREGYIFDGWYQGDDIVSLSKIYEFTAQKDESFTARFVHDDRINVVINAEEGGYVTGEGKYFKDEEVVIKAVSEDTYQFDGWYIDNEKISDDIEYQFDAAEDVTITAKFKSTDLKKDGKWIKEGSKWWYRYGDGSYPADTVCQIENKWYGFDRSGWMQTGWAVYNNKWYYFSQNGIMQTGWLTEQGNTYYLDSQGVMQTGLVTVENNKYYMNENGKMQSGWQKWNDAWYYFKEDGKMAFGWQKIDKYWYYLNSDGTRATGWKYINKEWYYLSSDGKMLTGFISVGNNKYYMNENGKMQTGWQEINSTWHYFKENGEMTVGWQKVNGSWYYLDAKGARTAGWRYINKKWYYMAKNGKMLTGWQNFNNIWYYFKETGSMAIGWQKISNVWYYFRENGSMTVGWQKINSVWYCFRSNGSMMTGWQKIGNAWYYLKKDGKMAVNWQKLGGKWYYLNANGKMQTGWQKIKGNWYYMDKNGVMQKSKWIAGTYYVKASGKMAVSEWVDHNRYYVNANGEWVKGKIKVA